MDEQKKLLQGLWRKAFLAEEPVLIPCKTEANATRLRFSLYNAVRTIRSGKQQVDETLQQATENVSVGFAPQDRTAVLMQRKVMTDLMQTIQDLVGDAPELVKSEEDMVMEHSQALLMEKLGSEKPGLTPAELGLPRSNPFYTRGG